MWWPKAFRHQICQKVILKIHTRPLRYWFYVPSYDSAYCCLCMYEHFYFFILCKGIPLKLVVCSNKLTSCTDSCGALVIKNILRLELYRSNRNKTKKLRNLLVHIHCLYPIVLILSTSLASISPKNKPQIFKSKIFVWSWYQFRKSLRAILISVVHKVTLSIFISDRYSEYGFGFANQYFFQGLPQIILSILNQEICRSLRQ